MRAISRIALAFGPVGRESCIRAKMAFKGSAMNMGVRIAGFVLIALGLLAIVMTLFSSEVLLEGLTLDTGVMLLVGGVAQTVIRDGTYALISRSCQALAGSQDAGFGEACGESLESAVLLRGGIAVAGAVETRVELFRLRHAFGSDPVELHELPVLAHRDITQAPRLASLTRERSWPNSPVERASDRNRSAPSGVRRCSRKPVVSWLAPMGREPSLSQISLPSAYTQTR